MNKIFVPFFLSLENKKCLVVGAGNVAVRKIKKLLACKASVFVIASDINNDIYSMDVTVEKRKFSFLDIENYFLVIAATNDRSLNDEIVVACENKNILVNSVTSKDNMNTRFCTSIEKENYSIGISANGDPKKAILIKKRILEIIEHE